jgi:hypothetical protein
MVKKKTRIWLEISNSGHAPNGIPSFASCIRMCGMSCKVWQWNLLMLMLREMWISSLWEYIHLWFLVTPLLGVLSCISPQQEVECGFSFHCYVTMARLPQLGYNIIISPLYIYITYITYINSISTNIQYITPYRTIYKLQTSPTLTPQVRCRCNLAWWHVAPQWAPVPKAGVFGFWMSGGYKVVKWYAHGYFSLQYVIQQPYLDTWFEEIGLDQVRWMLFRSSFR